MQILSKTSLFQIDKPTAAAIGKFDGIHLGHRKLLDRILRADRDGLASVVFTFEPSPAAFFSGKSCALLTTKDEKRDIFDRMGVDVLLEFPLNHETASMEPEEFIRRILVEQMYISYVAAGTDLSFGDRGRGDWHLLKALSEQLNYQTEVIDKVLYEGREISSTFVRENVEKGDMQTVRRLLGAPYTMIGTVAHGRKLGRTIGMPTVNLIKPADKLLPPNGVYFSRLTFKGTDYPAVTNIGTRPTVSGSSQIGVETHVYGLDQEIYGEKVIVSFYEFLRPEKKFAGIAQLQEGMDRDREKGLRYWEQHKNY